MEKLSEVEWAGAIWSGGGGSGGRMEECGAGGGGWNSVVLEVDVVDDGEPRWSVGGGECRSVAVDVAFSVGESK